MGLNVKGFIDKLGLKNDFSMDEKTEDAYHAAEEAASGKERGGGGVGSWGTNDGEEREGTGTGTGTAVRRSRRRTVERGRGVR